MIDDNNAEDLGNKMFGRGLARACLLIVQASIDEKTTITLLRMIAAFAKGYSPAAAEGFCSLFHGPFAEPWLSASDKE